MPWCRFPIYSTDDATAPKLAGLGNLRMSAVLPLVKWTSLGVMASTACAVYSSVRVRTLMLPARTAMPGAWLTRYHAVVQGVLFDPVLACTLALGVGTSARTRRLREIVLYCQLHEVASPSGWQVQARVVGGQLHLARWFSLFRVRHSLLVAARCAVRSAHHHCEEG